MLSAMRSSGSNVFVWIIIFLLIVGLAGFGISQSGGSGSELAVASVGDEEVTANEFGQAYQNEMQQLSQTFGRRPTQQEMQIFGGDQIVLARLLSLAALDGEASRLGLSVGDDVVRDRLMQTRAFQGVDGSFDRDAYDFILERSNISASDYEDSLRGDATRQIVATAISGGIDIGSTVPAAIVKFIAEKRGVSYIKLTPENLTSEVPAPAQSDLQAYYDANQDRYTRPETRDVTYVALREEDLLSTVEVSEEELVSEFEAREAEFQQPAMVSVDRLVFPQEADAKAALDAIISGESDFDAAVEARGLALADVELGEVTRNQLAADARDAVFGASEPGILGPFTSDLGPALYRINAVIPANTQTLADVRDALRTEIAAERASALLADAAEEIDDLIAGGATLEEVAQSTDMSITTITFDPDLVQGISADSAFRSEVLEAEVGEDRDLKDLSDGGLFALRVDAINEPHVPPLDEISDRVTQDWSADKTLEALRFRAEDLEKRVNAGETLADIAEDLSLGVETPDPVQRNEVIEGVPPALTEALFDGTNGDSVIVDDGSSAFLAMIGDLIPANLNDDANKAALERITQTLQGAVAEDMLNYFAVGLQDREGVSVNQSLIQSVLTQVHSY